MEKNKILIKKIIEVGLFILLVFTITLAIEIISRGNFNQGFTYISNNKAKFLLNSFIVSITFIPMYLFKRRLFYNMLITIGWLSISVGNNLVLKFRGTPLTRSDLDMIDKAIGMANQYLTKSNIIMMVLIVVILIVLLVVTYFKANKIKVNYKVAIIGVALYLIISPFVIKYAINIRVVDANYWDIKIKYDENGFPFSFYNSVVNTGMYRPLSYSKNTVNSIAEDLLIEDTDDMYASQVFNNINTDERDPNIILIQLESFIDPNWINNIEFNKEPIPNFREISDNYSSGLLTVPISGGGTANTEFEVITGFDTNFLGVGEFPYNTLVSSKLVPSLAYSLREIGYSTHSLHNFEGDFYSRVNVYKNLGFDTFTSIETMEVPERTAVGWPKDFVLVNEIKKLLTSTTSSDLVFGISVQGHGGYPNDVLETKEIEIVNDCNYSTKNSIEYYLNQIYEMDQFVLQLINMVNELNEPAVVVFYGDHHPAIGLSKDDYITESLLTTPYVIWDNIGLQKEDKDLMTYELVASIKRSINLPENIVDKIHNNDFEDKDEYLNIVQYDLLYGKKYSLDESLEISDSFSYGINVPSIDKVQTIDGNFIITGKNFNTYSNIYVNGKMIQTQFIDSTSIAIAADKVKKGDSISVSQKLAKDKTKLLTSNSIKY